MGELCFNSFQIPGYNSNVCVWGRRSFPTCNTKQFSNTAGCLRTQVSSGAICLEAAPDSQVTGSVLQD